MTDARWRQISLIYNDAVALSGDARAAFLRRACADDSALLADVESLFVDNSRLEQLLKSTEVPTNLIGTRIGSCEVVSLLGAGGMGQVYLARDTKLRRQVAVKILPAQFVGDSERLARFVREARALASLNHPNIAAIHSVEEIASTPSHPALYALVLELVEGDTLAERLAQASVPVPEALRIAREIADALDAAHDHGIVHRDLKPSNIKLTRDGHVKVLDFGLAKMAERKDSDDSIPTHVDSFVLRTGEVILGTPAYMSPEQARGLPVDKRTDIWAFGCVLFEILTGRAAFSGETVADILGAVLHQSPDLDRLPADAPPSVKRLLERCLAKDPRARLRDIGDAGDYLSLPAAGSPITTTKSRAGHIWLILGATAVISAAVFVTMFRHAGSAPVSIPREVRFLLDLGPMPTPHSMAISPDDRLIAFAGVSPALKLEGRPMSSNESVLLIRRLATLQFQSIPETEGAYSPFFSPAGDQIGFGASGRLKIADLQAGAVRTVCDIPAGVLEGGTWNSDNLILFSAGGVLYQVPSTGGTPVVVARPNAELGQANLRFPQFFPDGRNYVYRVSSLQPARRAVAVGTLGTRKSAVLMEGESNGGIGPGPTLVFTRRGSLVAQRLDAVSMRLIGEPRILADEILHQANGSAAFSVSAAGAVAYRTGGSRTLVWIDRDGRARSSPGSLDADFSISLSPDARRVAFHEPRGNAADDVYVYDLERGTKTQLTDSPGADHLPIWSPDGTHVAFEVHASATSNGGIYERRADGATPQRQLIPSSPNAHYVPRDWRPEFLLLSRDGAKGEQELWGFQRSAREPFRYLSNVSGASALSPDGRWVAYARVESGRPEVFVQSFPDASRSRHQISTGGGSMPRWRGDGRELYYVSGASQLTAAEVTIDRDFKLLRTIRLFAAPSNLYDVTNDGQQFLFNVPSSAVSAPTPVAVALNAVR